MPTPTRITGLSSGAVDTARRDIQFELTLSAGRVLPMVARFGVAEQVIGALGRMLAELRNALRTEKAFEPGAAELVVEADIRRDPFSDQVLLLLVTPEGTPYRFAMPHQTANDIADRLKTESERSDRAGNA